VVVAGVGGGGEALAVAASGWLFGADYVEVLVDEHVVWPVDADDVDVVVAAAQAISEPESIPHKTGHRRA